MNTELRKAVELFESLPIDHEPDGWPAVRMRDITLVVKALRDLEAENAENDELRQRMGELLTSMANALKGQPADLSLHSWHDLPEVAQALQSRLAAANALLRRTRAKDYDAAEQIRLVAEIDAHLQGAGDEAAD